MADLIALLSTAKSAGFDIGSLASLVTIYFMLKKFVAKQNDELKQVVSSQVDKIVIAIGAHNDRLESLEKDVGNIKQQLKGE